MREHGQRQRIGEPKQRLRLCAVIPKIVDHDRKPRSERSCLYGTTDGNRGNEMDRLRTLTIQQVIESLQAWRFGTHDAAQAMNIGNSSEFLLDRIVRGPVSSARSGEWNCGDNVVGGPRLWLCLVVG